MSMVSIMIMIFLYNFHRDYVSENLVKIPASGLKLGRYQACFWNRQKLIWPPLLVSFLVDTMTEVQLHIIRWKWVITDLTEFLTIVKLVNPYLLSLLICTWGWDSKFQLITSVPQRKKPAQTIYLTFSNNVKQ